MASSRKSKLFFKYLKNGHKVRLLYEASDENDVPVYINENGKHTEAFWEMLREARKEIEALELKRSSQHGQQQKIQQAVFPQLNIRA